MTSHINPSNINGQYPIAGQDNDSQGFRDNFTNTISNFTIAAAEITALQSNAVMVGTGVTNNMNGAVLANVRLSGAVDISSITSGTGSMTLDFAVASFYQITTSGSLTLNFTWNGTVPGVYAKMRVLVVASPTGGTLTLSAPPIGATAAGFTAGAMTLSQAYHMFELSTVDAGTTVFIRQILATS